MYISGYVYVYVGVCVRGLNSISKIRNVLICFVCARNVWAYLKLQDQLYIHKLVLIVALMLYSEKMTISKAYGYEVIE